MLPNFLIIGTMKGGTTSLYHYLGQHPEVFMTATKELHYFVAEKNLTRGASWYESNFRDAGAARAVGEASPDYTKYPLYRGVPRADRRPRPGRAARVRDQESRGARAVALSARCGSWAGTAPDR